MAILTTKIPGFINKAQTKLRQLGTSLLEEFDSQGYQNDVSEDTLLKMYETRQFIDLLLTSDYGGMTNKQISDTIDFFMGWLELHKVNAVNYTTYQMPISSQALLVDPNLYALDADLDAESTTRASADAALATRVTNLENASFDPADVFEPGFFNNYLTTYSVVFNDDTRLHQHANITQLNAFTAPLLEDLQALQTHYDSIGAAGSMHVTSAERTLWNAMTTPAQLTTALAGYSQTGHSHAIADINLLQATINALNTDIANMAGTDGADGRQIELQLNGDNLEYRYTGDVAWTSLGVVKGAQGDPFTIDVRAEAATRFSSAYDNVTEDFSFLATDTGYMYFRNPVGGLATEPGGWSTPFRFTGENGWSPMLGLYEVSAGRVVQELIDWVGGDGEKPVLDPGPSPSLPVRWFVGPNGFVLDQSMAINVKGVPGIGRGPVIGGQGTFAGRSAFDTEAEGFIYLRTDVSPQTIYIKESDGSGDWSVELPWQGEQGPAGPPGSVSFVASVNTSGAAVQLDCQSYSHPHFYGSVPIAAPASFSLLNFSLTFEYKLFFNLSGLHSLTLPLNTDMADVRYTKATRVWAPTSAGTYALVAWWTGSSWMTTISGPIET